MRKDNGDLTTLLLLLLLTATAVVKSTGAAAAITTTTTTTGDAKRVNLTSSTGGLVWSTAKEEPDLVRSNSVNGEGDGNGVDEFDGGFPSLEGMLQWAIGNSDPAKLKETAKDVQRLSQSELNERQMEIKELMEKLKMPSDAQLMQIAIDDLNNTSTSLEDRHRALQELLILVEPIDNANDLNKLGGLIVLVRGLSHPDSDVRRLSAWVLGKASQNNPLVQKQILELGALPELMKMLNAVSVEESIKALYAVSALIRNNLNGQQLFYEEAGDMMLQDLLSNSSNDVGLRRKAVFLITDLAECQLENPERDELPFFSNQSFIKSVVDLTGSTDLDLQEKALAAIKNLLLLRTTEATTFRDFCQLDVVLRRMKQQFQNLMLEEVHREYATDLESMRMEVEQIFLAKLREVQNVPT